MHLSSGRGIFRSQSERVMGSQKVVVTKMFVHKEDHHTIFEEEENKTCEDGLTDSKMLRSTKGKSRFRLGRLIGSSNHNLNNEKQDNKNDLKSDLWLKNGELSHCESDLGDAETSEASMPVLLSVRKRCSSDSGHDSSYNSSPSPTLRGHSLPSPCQGSSWHPDQRGKSKSSSKKNNHFFRLFHRSATLLFNHPTSEINPNKPYKGAISLGRPKTGHRVNKISVSSSSSLNSSVLHHHLEHDVRSEDVASTDPKNLPPLHSSASSVISSVDSSNYDSGAFSRTSSPELKGASAQVDPRAVLALAAPLSAPSLVLAVCRGDQRRVRKRHFFHSQFCLENGVDSIGEEDEDSVDAGHILACLDATSMPSYSPRHNQYFGLLPPNEYKRINSSRQHDVSITVGSNTKLTIANPTSLRRSRSGLPLLGTSGLEQNFASLNLHAKPAKPVRKYQSKISTVYLATSESPVKVKNDASDCDSAECCDEKVTVNGQHHCCKRKRDESQPSSLINI